MKRKKKNKIYLYLLIILGLTVGFALLSTTLNINGTAGIKSNTWDIHWDEESIQVTENSVQANTPIVTEEGQKVSYAVTLELPGDFYEFTIDAVNAGTVDGMVNIDGLTPTIKNKTTGEVTTLPSYIKYSVTYADGSQIEQFHKLAKRVDADTPTREKFKIRIEYDSQSSELSDDDKEFEIDDDLPYIPDDGRGKDRDSLDTYTLYQSGYGVKSTTLDSSWNLYFKFIMQEKFVENDIYSFTGSENDIETDSYDYGYFYNSMEECNAYLTERGLSDIYTCELTRPKGSKTGTPKDISACMVTSIGETFCYEYDKYDCNYDENIGDCDNTSTYILQKKNEIQNKGGYYKTKYENNSLVTAFAQDDLDQNENASSAIYVIKNDDYFGSETLMIGNRNTNLNMCIYSNNQNAIVEGLGGGLLTDPDTNLLCSY